VTYGNEIYQFNMKNVKVEQPKSESLNHYGQPMTPQECRSMKNNYIASIFCDVHFIMFRISPTGHRQTVVEKTVEHELLMQMPIMLRSKFCWTYNMSQAALRKVGEDQFEPGGYFIIEGSERAIVSQDEKATNYVYLNYRKQKKLIDASIKSRSRSMLYSDISSHLNVILEETSHKFYVTLNLWSSKKNQIPINLMFQALGAVTDREILNHMIGDLNNTELYNIVYPSLINDVNKEVANRDVAARVMIHKMLVGNSMNISDEDHAKRMKEKIDTQFLPHLGTDDVKKRFFLGYMCWKVLNLAVGRLQQDDIFNYGNKRIHSAVILLGMHASQILNQLRKNMQNAVANFRKQQNDVAINDIHAETVRKLFHNPQVQKKIANTMATGRWNIGSSHYTPSNKISMMMERKSRFDPISLLRRISTGTRENNTNLEVHLLNGSLWGTICPAETPESDKIGLMKHLAVTSHITVNNDGETVNLRSELEKLYKDGHVMRLSTNQFQIIILTQISLSMEILIIAQIILFMFVAILE
jgi:DNA-directed RNA polymerase II subunit RPB2